MSLTVTTRSDKFPVGTVVSAFAGGVANRHFEGKPSGTALETATVDAAGHLNFAGLGEGIYALWASVAGANANLLAGSQGFTAPGTLAERIAARRALVGA